MDDTIDILERFPAIHLRARDHVDAVTAVRRQGWTWPVGRPHRRDGEEKSSEGQNDKHEDEEKDPEGAHIRRGLPSVLTLSGGRYEEGPARAVGGACARGPRARGLRGRGRRWCWNDRSAYACGAGPRYQQSGAGQADAFGGSVLGLRVSGSGSISGI